MSTYILPDDNYYTETHEWLQVDENIVTVGRTEFSEEKLGEIIYVELPEVGNRTNKNEAFGVIESVKEMSDLIAPVSGIVIEVNDAIFENPSLLNDDPMNTGWLVRIELDSEKELTGLARASDYRKFITGKGKFEVKAQPLETPKNDDLFESDLVDLEDDEDEEEDS